MKRYTIYLLLLLVWSATAHTATISLAPDRTWIPTKDNTCEVTINLTGAASNSKVIFQLISTNWRGFCMNAGDEADESPDLKFADAQSNTAEEPSSVGLTWELKNGSEITAHWTDTAPTSFKVKIRCYDYGAIGKINAGLYNGADENGNRQYVTANTMIPYSTNNNYIADEQESKTGWSGWNGSNEDDSESGPIPNTHTGDGLTAFEEYRGFYIKGTHKRTSPLKKDVFYHTDTALAAYGIGWADQLPTIFTLHPIEEDEMVSKGSRIINSRACKPFHILNQKAIWMQVRTTSRGDAMGKVHALVNPAQGPARWKRGEIYVNIIRNRLPRTKDFTKQVKKTIGQ